MARVIEIDKNITRNELDKKLSTLAKKKAPVNLKKYFGKVKFDTDGLTYQLKARNEWR